MKEVDKKYLIVGLVNTNHLLPTNHNNRILPSTNLSLVNILELPNKNPRRFLNEHMLEVLTEFFSKNSNFKKNEDLIQWGRIDKLPCVENIPKEQMCFHEEHQGEDHTSY